MGETFVVIGGDAAGMSAASKARRDAPDLDIVAFEKGEWVSYAACGMPYFVKGDVADLDALVSITADEFVSERDIDLRTGAEVVAIDPSVRTVTVETAADRYEQPYDHLLVATGARAIEPPFPGLDLEGVFTLHRMGDAAAIDTYLDEHDLQRAAIVGGGYVGVEMAEALAARGLEVSMYEMLDRLLQPFGEPGARRVEDHLREHGVDLHLETAVEGFLGDDRVEAVDLGGDRATTDLVVVGVGVEPNVDLAEAAGVEIGPTGAIATDRYGRTNLEGVYAAGDCAEVDHAVTGEADWVPLALTANRAGRAVGQTVAGDPTPVGETAGTAIVKAFDLGIARTGLTDPTAARAAGFAPVEVDISARTRAGYYPGARPLHVHLLADGESRRLLGATLVGEEGAKRIDTVATALHAGLTVDEVERLDLAYAPPFSPVWDPVLTAAKVLAGRLDQ
ncbi:MAG: FAD-dependent oxidoreductase [Halobacteriales archaeon]